MNSLGAKPDAATQPAGYSNRHPHTIGEWNLNNTIYLGTGHVATKAHADLRLTRMGEQVSRWRVPPWLRTAGLTYHGRPDRWVGEETLFSSKFRSRRRPLDAALGQKILRLDERFQQTPGCVSESYVDAMPYEPPLVDQHRWETYQGLLRNAPPFVPRERARRRGDR